VRWSARAGDLVTSCHERDGRCLCGVEDGRTAGVPAVVAAVEADKTIAGGGEEDVDSVCKWPAARP
jgi:hypothetical protein